MLTSVTGRMLTLSKSECVSLYKETQVVDAAVRHTLNQS